MSSAQWRHSLPCSLCAGHCLDSPTEPCLVVVPAIRHPNVKHIGGLLSSASSVWVRLAHEDILIWQIEAHWFQVMASGELRPRSVWPPSPCLVPVLGGLLRSVTEQYWLHTSPLCFVRCSLLPAQETNHRFRGSRIWSFNLWVYTP